jgi:hypothetical protein
MNKKPTKQIKEKHMRMLLINSKGHVPGTLIACWIQKSQSAFARTTGGGGGGLASYSYAELT